MFQWMIPSQRASKRHEGESVCLEEGVGRKKCSGEERGGVGGDGVGVDLLKRHHTNVQNAQTVKIV